MSPIPLDYAGRRPDEPSVRRVGPLRRVVLPVVLGLIGWIALSALWPRPRTPSLTNVAATGAHQVWAALREFQSDHGRFPTQREGPDALLKPPPRPGNPAGPYLPKIPADPWGRPFVYHAIPNASPDPRRSMVLSVGPDGREGTADDIAFAN